MENKINTWRENNLCIKCCESWYKLLSCFFTFHEVASSNTFVPPFLLRCLLRNEQEGGRAEEPLTFLQQCDNIDLVWIEIKKMNLVVKQWTNIHKPFYDFLKNAAYFFSFKLIKFNKRKIAKIEIGCYVMNWREEPLTFPQECSNMCLAHFKCTSVHFKFLKTTTLPPKYLESDSMAIVFLGHYQDAVSLLLSIQHTIIHLNNWTLLFIFISFLISHVTNPLHLRARSVLFVSKKGWSHTPAPSLILPQIKENCTDGQPESFLLQSQRVETDIISLLWNSTGNPYCGKIWRKNTFSLSTQERCSCNLCG